MCAALAALALIACRSTGAGVRADAGAQQRAGPTAASRAVRVQYLEIVTPDVDATCRALTTSNGVAFGPPVAAFGDARTASLAGGGRIGVRAPMHAAERPVVRPYVLVDDIEAAFAAAVAAGAEVAHPPLEIPGEGTFAIYVLAGIEHGLWQL